MPDRVFYSMRFRVKRPLGRTVAAALLVSGSVDASEALDFDARYTGEAIGNVSGGRHSGSTYLDNLDLTLEIDVAAAFGAGRGTVFLYGLYNNGSTFADEYVGDLQVTSNIDAPEALRLFEAWYEVGGESWSLRSGLYDLNSEFDVTETGGLFLNSSHGIGPEFSQTGDNGPGIFPISSLTVRAAWQGENLTARLAVLDGVPGEPADPASNDINLGGSDGALVVAELDVPLPSGGRTWGGVWQYSKSFERPFGSGRSDDNNGWYLGVEQSFEMAGYGAAAFLRIGKANESLNVLEDYIGAGIVIDAPYAARPQDQLGLAVASAGAGRPYRQSLEQAGVRAESRETTWELTYRMPMGERLTLQPDLQYVINPSANAAIDNALAVALRFELAY